MTDEPEPALEILVQALETVLAAHRRHLVRALEEARRQENLAQVRDLRRDIAALGRQERRIYALCDRLRRDRGAGD